MNTPNPAYLGLKKLEQLLQLLSTRSFKVIDRKTLMESYRYGDSDSSIATSTLKFLGITKPDNSVNEELLTSITAKSDEKRTSALAKMVQDSYSTLFTAFPTAATASTDELHDEFKRVYKITTRITKDAIPTFVYLCEIAGLREKSLSTKVETAKRKSDPIKRVAKGTQARSPLQGQNTIPVGATPIAFANGDFQLVLPTKVLSNTHLLKQYQTLLTALQTFEGEYVKEYATNTGSNDNKE